MHNSSHDDTALVKYRSTFFLLNQYLSYAWIEPCFLFLTGGEGEECEAG